MKSVTNLCTLLSCCAVIVTAQQKPAPTTPGVPAPTTPGVPAPTTPGAPAPTTEPAKEAPKYAIRRGHNMQGIPLATLLEEYALLTGKTMIIGKNLPKVTFDFKANNDLTHEESKSFYETLLMQQQIAVVPQGDKFIKVIAAAEVLKNPPVYYPVLEYDALPDSEVPVMGPYVLKAIDPVIALELLTGMAKSTKAISVVAGSDVLFIRDSAVNVKRMLLMLEQVDVEIAIKEEYELVKIRYALSADIAAVLSTLTNTPRTSGSRTSTSGRTTGGTTGRTTGGTTGRTTGGTTGRTSGGSSSLANRLSQIQRGGSTGVTGVGLPILGDTQVVSYQRGNEVLLIGTRRHLDRAKELIEKLDTVQPQVLIEAIIIDVALGDDKTFGVSLRQNKNVIGRVPGGNGDLSSALASALGPSGFTDTSISGATTGFNYWGFLGNTWEVAVEAIQNDSRVTMLSRPRIQTSHAELAELFIGDTRPVVTGTITDISGGTSSQYQMQKFGITLNVVPFINEEGLVVMEIQQQIQDIVGSQTINGNAVPIVTDRSANAKVAVRDGEMIVLGGFIKTKTTTYEDGVPILRDIPLLGKLFEKTQDIDERNELIVLMRPTVLKTPEAAAIKAMSEQANLPGIDLAKDEEKRLQEKYRRLAEEIRKKRKGDIDPEDSIIPGNLKDQPLVPELPE